jgi:hypothetical protein
MNLFQWIHKPKWKIYRRFSLALSLSLTLSLPLECSAHFVPKILCSFRSIDVRRRKAFWIPKTMLTDNRSSLLPSWSERPVAIRQTIWLSYIAETCAFNINCCDVNAVYSITYDVRCRCWWTVFTTFLSAFLSSVSLFLFYCCGSCLCQNTIYIFAVLRFVQNVYERTYNKRTKIATLQRAQSKMMLCHVRWTERNTRTRTLNGVTDKLIVNKRQAKTRGMNLLNLCPSLCLSGSLCVWVSV